MFDSGLMQLEMGQLGPTLTGEWSFILLELVQSSKRLQLLKKIQFVILAQTVRCYVVIFLTEMLSPCLVNRAVWSYIAKLRWTSAFIIQHRAELSISNILYQSGLQPFELGPFVLYSIKVTLWNLNFHISPFYTVEAFSK